MAAKTTIEWCNRTLPDGTVIPGHTWQRWWGCVKVASECKNCYAEVFAKRIGKDVWGPAANTGRWILGDDNLKKPFTWNRAAQASGHRHNVFCSSMSDIFEDNAILDEPRQQVWQIINETPWLNWLLLTKRPGNILTMAPWGKQWPDNVWVGTSVGTQERADEEIDKLLEVPAVVRFLSVEPQLEHVDLTPWLPSLQWIICGGESGLHARPFKIGWARSLRDQCSRFDVPFFFKQIGGRYHNSGGRLLDGQTWDQMPPEFPVQEVING
jgi:protein gp37